MTAIPFYIVIDQYDGEDYVIDRPVADCTRASIVADIASGEIRDMTRVIEVGSGRDVTEDFARAVMQTWAEADEPLTDYQRDFVEQHIGIAAANAFRRAA